MNYFYLMAPAKVLKETSSAIYTLKEDGIVHVHFKAQSVITLEEQAKNFDAHLEFIGSRPHCVIYTADEFVNFTPEAKQRSKELELKLSYIASAAVTKNLAYKMIADFYIRLNKPQKPFRNFRNEEEALKWLRTFLK